jgi:hypothetical protein
MSSSSAIPKKKAVPLAPLLTAMVVVLAFIAGVVYLNRPAPTAAESIASQEVKGYLKNLALSDVKVQASENLLNQKVVEVVGNISNNGPRDLNSIDVVCFFYNVEGHPIHRERSRIVGGAIAPGSLKPGETKSFRMPFEGLPDGWNQDTPKMVIGQIAFVN